MLLIREIGPTPNFSPLFPHPFIASHLFLEAFTEIWRKHSSRVLWPLEPNFFAVLPLHHEIRSQTISSETERTLPKERESQPIRSTGRLTRMLFCSHFQAFGSDAVHELENPDAISPSTRQSLHQRGDGPALARGKGISNPKFRTRSLFRGYEIRARVGFFPESSRVTPFPDRIIGTERTFSVTSDA